MEISIGTYKDIKAITGFQIAMAMESEGTVLDPDRICCQNNEGYLKDNQISLTGREKNLKVGRKHGNHDTSRILRSLAA